MLTGPKKPFAARSTIDYDERNQEAGVLATLPLYHYLHEKNRQYGNQISSTIKKLRDSGRLAQVVAAAETDFLAGR